MDGIIKKCPLCGYEGEEDVCPDCDKPTEPICPECNRAESNCLCEETTEEENNSE